MDNILRDLYFDYNYDSFLMIKVISILKNYIGENHYFTKKELANLLSQQGIKFTTEKLDYIINVLLYNQGEIVRYDKWYKEPSFYVLDYRCRDSIYQKSFYNMEDDDANREKKFILIGDTHIGNEQVQDFDLIHNIYDFALKNNIKDIIHLGDLFTRINTNDSWDNKAKNVEQLINLFIKYYPNVKEIRTLNLIGNHDETIYGSYGIDVFYDWVTALPQIFDLRLLTKVNNNMLFYPRKTFILNLNKIKIHFSHRFYINDLRQDIKLYKLDTINKLSEEILSRYSIYFSAHLHQHFIRTACDSFHRDILYVGVPSTSKLCINNVVANLITLTNDKQIFIQMICVDQQNKPFISETYSYPLTENGFVLTK